MGPDIKVEVHHVGPAECPEQPLHTSWIHTKSHISMSLRLSVCDGVVSGYRGCHGVCGCVAECRAAEALPWWLWAFRMAS